MSNSRRTTTERSLMTSKPSNKSAVASFSIDRRVNIQLEKMAKAGGVSKSKLALFFLEKRCIAP
jgi:hypothetical protein